MRFVIHKNVLMNSRDRLKEKDMKTKEEVFRINGKPVATSLTKMSSITSLTLIQLFPSLLNKRELQELINWLISKLDEME